MNYLKLEQLKLDGKYTKLLKAFANAYGLKHLVKLDETGVVPSLEVEVFVETRQFQSILDVFEHGKIAYVSSMRKYTTNIQEDTIEKISKEIIDGICKPNRYMKSMKGGNELMVTDGHLEPVEKYICQCPTSIEELFVKIDLAGIDINDVKVEMTYTC